MTEFWLALRRGRLTILTRCAQRFAPARRRMTRLATSGPWTAEPNAPELIPGVLDTRGSPWFA